MNYLRDAFSAASQYYKELPPINPSTLTGAIDVIVVRRSGEDGQTELACSPFHVRFGKWQVLRPGEKKVDVVVNDQVIPFHMKIGDAGEAFFIFETEEDVPEDLITSPLLEATSNGIITHNHESKEGDPGPTDFGGLAEPEYLDLNGTPPIEDPKRNRPSGLSLTKPVDVAHTLHTSDSALPTQVEASDDIGNGSSSPTGPANILGRAAHLGKAIVKAAVETEKEHQAQVADKVDAARNAIANGYARWQGDKRTDNSWEARGDEALPHVEEGEGSPPPVVYHGDVVLDMAGYHSKTRSDETITNSRPHSQPSGDFAESETWNNATPPSSRSLSPEPGSVHSEVARRDPPIQAIRATSEPPESPPRSPPQYSWEWGAFPQRSPVKATFTTSLDSGEHHRSSSVPPQIKSDRLELTNRRHVQTANFDEGGELTVDYEDPRRFILRMGNRTYDLELSTCGPLSHGKNELEDARKFNEQAVTFKKFIKSPLIVHDKNLVIRWNDKFITRQDGSFLMESLVAWRDAALAKPANASALSEEEPLSSSDEHEPEMIKRTTSDTMTKRSWVRWWKLSRSEQRVTTKGPDSTLRESSSAPLSPDVRPSTSAKGPQYTDLSLPESEVALPSHHTKRYAKTLRLTSDQLKALNLKVGSNNVTFSLATSKVVACTARIFLWEGGDRIVISDIDGTITKSDALGHVFTMIGRDWTHLGVAKLYTDICRNGYKIMYLTSRAIGQADSTRDYLKGINQNNYQLPEGPVIMSPDRLMASLHREVIMRKPEVFKMACLRDIQRLFGDATENPFYAGFGNRITDALSYRSVNVPSARIFTIDSSGEVKMELLELAGYKSSYIHMTDLVDQMFPPIHRTWATEFTDFNYWKPPVQEFPLPDFAPPSPALSALSETSNQSAFSRLRNFSLGRQSGKSFALPPPATQRDETDRERHLQHMSSFERLTHRLSLYSEAGADGMDRTARRRMSIENMPGSLPGSLGSHGEFGYGDEEEEGDAEGDDEEYDGGETPQDEEQAAEEAFDDDLFATGEMQNVPFL
ncbi:LNS2-domain-containing protein [Rickenella mellea]|uniref:phosphatidate phosphatase n=1 Tax=Rickenella mellea TaxID=50990 RepID=A0A4R5XEW8_9AGAM|nr:LNS2-domain-containing protein [Rickenella mellea]